MARRVTTVLFLVALGLAMSASGAMALSGYLTGTNVSNPGFNVVYPTSTIGALTGARCAVCHDTTSGPNQGLNAYGAAWKVQHDSGLTTRAAFQAIEGINSDNDPTGATNIAEITANTVPGWTAGANNTFYDLADGTTVVATNQSPPTFGASVAGLDPAAAPVNQAPVLPSIANQQGFEGQLLTFTVSATDADGPASALRFSAGNLPTGATLTDNLNGSATFNWTPSFTQANTYPNVSISVADQGTPVGTASRTFSITVGNTNRPPTLTNPGAQTATEGVLLTFQASATDPDGDPLSFSGSNLPTGATVSPSGLFSWTPSFTQAGSYPNVTISVTDGAAPTISQSFTITVGNVNRAPTLTNPGAKTATEGVLLTFQASATDPDSDPLTFSCGNLPSGATVSPTGLFSWTPSFTQAGNYTNVTISVSDGTTSVSQTFNISVGNVNRAPTLTNPGAQTASEGVLLQFQASATDPDNDPMTFSGTNLPSGATVSPSGLFSWTPSFTQAGNYTNVTINVSDGTTSVSQSFNISVGNVNRAPTLTNPGAQTATEGVLLTFQASATDPDGDPLTFSGGNLPLGASVSANGVFSWTPAAGQAGSYPNVSINATDGTTSVSQSFTITVAAQAPQDTVPPVLTLPSNMTVAATSASGAVATFTATANDAVDGSRPVSCSPASGSTFPIATTTVSCSASDTHSNTATGSFTVTVQDIVKPVLTLPANMTVAATSASGAVVTFTASASDAIDGSRPVSCTPASGSTFPVATTTVNCSASDTHGNTASGSFTVTVTAQQAQDTVPPVLTLPANMTVQATSSAGAAVSFTATASDAVDGSRPVSCSPASGSTFPIATTTVSCSASDTHSNTATGSFTVTVQDTVKPVLTLPANMTVPATSASGAVVTFTASANDAIDGSRPVSCTPASGSTFPVATTTVNCSASDTHGNTASGSFTVAVTAQTTPPPTTTGSVKITTAKWDDHELKVEGYLTPRPSTRVTVTITNADTGATLTMVRTDSRGQFETELGMRSAPCRIQAKAGTYSSAIVTVSGASCSSGSRDDD
jgi:Bacterial Ig domain/HYR domain